MFSVSLTKNFEMRNISFVDIFLMKKLIYAESSALLNIYNVSFQMNHDANIIGVAKILDGGFIRIENSLNMEFSFVRILFSIGNQNIGIIIVNQLENTETIAKYLNYNGSMQVKLLKYKII